MSSQKVKFTVMSIASSMFFTMACTTSRTVTSTYKPLQYKVDTSMRTLINIDRIIAPYRDSLSSKMNIHLAYTSAAITKTGSDQSPLGNWCADALLQAVPGGADMSLLNSGGLRAPLPKGNVNVGNIYELMPFDNEVVIVTLSPDSVKSLVKYLCRHRGLPISGITLLHDTMRHQCRISHVGGKRFDPSKSLSVATSDYLATGGDGMTFLSSPNTRIPGERLRDLLIRYTGSLKDTIRPKLDKRVQTGS